MAERRKKEAATPKKQTETAALVLLSLSFMLPLSRPAETVCEYEVQFHQRLEQERAQWNQYREAVERELGELRRRLTEGQEEENLEDEMKKVGSVFCLNVGI